MRKKSNKTSKRLLDYKHAGEQIQSKVVACRRSPQRARERMDTAGRPSGWDERDERASPAEPLARKAGRHRRSSWYRGVLLPGPYGPR